MQTSFEARTILKERLLALTKDDWVSICTGILIPNHENITINKSGVFFCMLNLSDESVLKIKNYIDHKNTFKE